MKSTIFWNVTPCTSVEVHGYFGETYPSSGWKCKPGNTPGSLPNPNPHSKRDPGERQVDQKEPVGAKEKGEGESNLVWP
jgi:hypothetical protein